MNKHASERGYDASRRRASSDERQRRLLQFTRSSARMATSLSIERMRSEAGSSRADGLAMYRSERAMLFVARQGDSQPERHQSLLGPARCCEMARATAPARFPLHAGFYGQADIVDGAGRRLSNKTWPCGRARSRPRPVTARRTALEYFAEPPPRRGARYPVGHDGTTTMGFRRRIVRRRLFAWLEECSRAASVPVKFRDARSSARNCSEGCLRELGFTSRYPIRVNDSTMADASSEQERVAEFSFQSQACVLRSNTHMVRCSNSKQSTFTSPRHQVYARLFGRCIEKIRESRCQSLEEMASGGMESSEGAAIEAGHRPGDEAQLQSMAGALECHYDQIVRLAFVCKEPGACKLSCRRPRTSGGTGGG